MDYTMGVGTCKVALDGENIASMSVLTVNGNTMTKVFFRQLPEATEEVLRNGKILGTIRVDDGVYFPVVHNGMLYRGTREKLTELCEKRRDFCTVKRPENTITKIQYDRAVKGKLEATEELTVLLHEMALSKIISDMSNNIPLVMHDVVIDTSLGGGEYEKRIGFVHTEWMNRTDISNKTRYADIIDYYSDQILSELGVELSVQFDFKDKSILYELDSIEQFGVQMADCVKKLVESVDKNERDTGNRSYRSTESRRVLQSQIQKIREGQDIILAVPRSNCINGYSDSVKIKAGVKQVSMNSPQLRTGFSVNVSFRLQFKVANNSVDLIYNEAVDQDICGTKVEMMKLRKQFMSIIENQRETNAKIVSQYEEFTRDYKEKKQQWDEEQENMGNVYKKKMKDALTRTIMIGRDLA